MSILYPFMRRALPYAMGFMLFACGSGSDGDPAGANVNLAATSISVPGNVFIATLNSAQGIPANSSNATGIGVVLIDPSTRLMRTSVTAPGIAATSVNIQLAEAGTVGPIALPLTEIPAGSGVWSAQTTLTEDQLMALRSGNYYFNVGNAAFPKREIRGQIVLELSGSGLANTTDLTPLDTNGVSSDNFTNGNTAATNPTNPIGPGSSTGTTIGSSGFDTIGTGTNTATGTIPLPGAAQQTVFINMLTGTQQVPFNSSPAVAVGVVIVDATGQGMVASITSIGISGLSAHIHQAVPGVNGATVFALNETAVGSGTWAVRLALIESQRSAFTNGDYYFDIHTAAFPDGELRGQIVANNGTGSFDTGSTGINTGGTGSSPGIMTENPFVPGSVTGSGNTDSFVTGNTDASVPSFGNPVGSGIGGASNSDVSSTSVPTFGNPAGSGIGGASSSNVSSTSVPTFGNPAGSGIGIDTGSSVTTGSGSGFTLSPTDAF